MSRMQIAQPAETLQLPGIETHYADSYDPRELDAKRKIALFNFMPERVRNHVIAMLGEFVGTFLFLFFAFAGTQVANTVETAEGETYLFPNTSNLLYIALVFGFSLTVNVWVFFRITGGMFNPAVTFALCLIGAVGWIRGALVVVAQILGAIASSAVVSALFPGPMSVLTGLGPGTSITRGLFIEMFLTAQLIFTIIFMAAEKNKATFVAPVCIGLALFSAELAGVWFTGGSLNPARSFGPALVLGTFDGYHWIYWLGPILGALVAVGFYKLVKALEYETVNPGQDSSGKDIEEFHEDQAPPKHIKRTPTGVPARRYDGSRESHREESGKV